MNCSVHMWPRRGSESIGSQGSVEYKQCNNCLAVRVDFTKTVKKGDEWVRVTDTQIVEPKFD